MGAAVAGLLLLGVFFTGQAMMSRSTIHGNLLVALATKEAIRLSGERSRTIIAINDTNTDGFCNLTVDVDNTGAVAIKDIPIMDVVVQFPGGTSAPARLVYVGSNGQENHQQAVVEPVSKTRDHDNDATKKTSQATQILSMLEDKKYEFFHSDSRVYTTFPVHEHFETWPIRRKGFKQRVAYQFYLTNGKTPGSQALQDALTTIEGKAIYESTQQDVHLRIGGSEEEIYIDLCNDNWETIHITSEGWDIVPHGSVKFIRGVGMLPLPIPKRGGSLDKLRPFINVSSDDDWRLFIGWLVNAIRPTGPQLGMQLDGEQGTGKTTVSDILKTLIDPNIAGKRSEPRDIRDLMIAARSNRILAFDNLSGLPVWLSDGRRRRQIRQMRWLP